MIIYVLSCYTLSSLAKWNQRGGTEVEPTCQNKPFKTWIGERLTTIDSTWLNIWEKSNKSQ